MSPFNESLFDFLTYIYFEMQKHLLRRFFGVMVLLFGSTLSLAQEVKVYFDEIVPAIGPFTAGSSPAIGTVFTGTDPWGLPWFSDDPDTTYQVVFESFGTTGSPSISDQVIMEKVINFCGQSNIEFRLNSNADTDLSWLFVSPNSNPQFATEFLALPSGELETVPPSAPISPQGGIFIRCYLADDSDACDVGVEWRSTEQPTWTPLLDGDFTTLNTYPSTLTDTLICEGSSTTLSMDNSDLGVSYVLRNNEDDSVIEGPFQGTGGTLDFNTGPITETTTFNVYSLGEDDALFFDGVDDHVVLPNIADHSLTDGSIELIIRPESVPSNQTLIAFENATGTLNRYRFFLLPDLTGVGFDNGTTVETISIGLSEGLWQTLSFVDDGTNTEAYLDGLSIGTFPTQFGTDSDPTMNVYLGTNGPETEPYNGDMEEVRMFNTPKTATEISNDLDSCMMGCENGLIAFYNFEDSYGSTTLQDLTLNGNDGVLTNMDEFSNWVGSTPLTCASCDVQMIGLYTVQVPYSFQTIEICEGDSSFHEMAWQTVSGAYFDTLTSSLLGCDSIIETDLIVHASYEEVQEVISLCDGDSALIFGNYESTEGLYYDSLMTVQGCDSVIVQELLVGTSFYTILEDDYICPFDSVEVFGDYVFLPGTYFDTLMTVSGCDSIFEQTIVPSLNPTVGLMDYGTDPICEQSGPVVLPLGSPAGGVYSGIGVSGSLFDPTGLAAGEYTTTYTFTTIHGCSRSDSTKINVVNCLGVEDWGADFQVDIYPNPSKGVVHLDLTEVTDPVDLEIYNSIGKKVYETILHEGENEIDLHVESGIYLLKLSHASGQVHRRLLIE